MKNRFSKFTVDELHTIATALGNATFRIREKEEKASDYGDCDSAFYLHKCARDNEILLKEINEAFANISASSLSFTEQGTV